MPKKLTAYLYAKGLNLDLFDIEDLGSKLDSRCHGETIEEAYKYSFDMVHDEDAMYKIEVVITKMTPAEVADVTNT